MRLSTDIPVVAWLVLSLTACTQESTAPTTASALMAARQQLVADLGQCTKTFGYDPNQTTGIAENQLAPHELQWRQCGYDAVNKYARAEPALADKYQQLINEDITMTNAIQAGAMTRTQRHQRIDTLIGQIKDAEESMIRASALAQEQQLDQVRQVMEQIRIYH